ncbi:hypothetical protein GCM10011491_35410 [Brucella endophytica]|uniref:DUF7673 domain-containing protein n=1 Tax=Brucella endophytica TaxID=1963359 RepID=A0A916WJN4_9HYPH|nr:hypothetical protein [Brucella endophytica]GGB04209.1 hypothetical protein GCM10011491_35410 [Brucella endophytica]
MDHATRAAFERLLKIALSDMGQSGRVAAFVLAWWNADTLGGFNIADLSRVDSSIAADMIHVLSWLAAQTGIEYPTAYRSEIEEIIRKWRPEIWAQTTEVA